MRWRPFRLQPDLPPTGVPWRPFAEAHRYHSFCVLETMQGSMEGSYLVERSRGERLRVAIPRFPLHAAAN